MACNGDCGNCPSNLEKLICEGSKTIQDVRAINGFSMENLPKPTSAVINVTDMCNNRCPYCFASDNSNHMSLETAQKAISFLQGNCGEEEKPTIVFFGGEPLLRFNEIIKPIVEEYGDSANWSVTTNGTLLSEEMITFFAENNVQVLLSFDGIKEVQDVQRPMKNGKSSYDEILRNLDYLLMKIPTVTARATVTKFSLPYMFESMILFEKLGFQHCVFCLNERDKFNQSDFKIMQEQLFKCAEYIYTQLLLGKTPIKNDSIIEYFNEVINCHDTPTFDNRVIRCGMGTTSVGIAYNGDLSPCQEENTTLSRVIGNVETGIDEQKHFEYLKTYFDYMSNLNCGKNCSNTNRLFCYNNNCPNVIFENRGQLSQTHCYFYQAAFLVGRRLEMLCRHSINPAIAEYFGGGA